MNHVVKLIILATIVFCMAVKAKIVTDICKMSDTQLRVAIMYEEQRYAEYTGGTGCLCPYNLDAAGRPCHGRDLYTVSRGKAVVCFPHDVSARDLYNFRQLRCGEHVRY